MDTAINVHRSITNMGLDDRGFGTHSLRRTRSRSCILLLRRDSALWFRSSRDRAVAAPPVDCQLEGGASSRLRRQQVGGLTGFSYHTSWWSQRALRYPQHSVATLAAFTTTSLRQRVVFSAAQVRLPTLIRCQSERSITRGWLISSTRWIRLPSSRFSHSSLNARASWSVKGLAR